MQVVTHCGAALWALGVSSHVRKLLESQAELLPSLLAALKRSTELPLALEGQIEGANGKYGEATRNQMQVRRSLGRQMACCSTANTSLIACSRLHADVSSM